MIKHVYLFVYQFYLSKAVFCCFFLKSMIAVPEPVSESDRGLVKIGWWAPLRVSDLAYLGWGWRGACLTSLQLTLMVPETIL